MNHEVPLSQEPPQLPNLQPSAAWLAASIEAALEPQLPIIDCHHHLSEHWGGYLLPDPDFKHGVLPRPIPQLYADPAFRRGYAHLERHGLSFDAWIYHPQLPEVIDLAATFPNMPLILDHVGGLLGVGPYEGRRTQAIREWLPALRLLAQCPNVTVKLGGLGTTVFGFDFGLHPLRLRRKRWRMHGGRSSSR